MAGMDGWNCMYLYPPDVLDPLHIGKWVLLWSVRISFQVCCIVLTVYHCWLLWVVTLHFTLYSPKPKTILKQNFSPILCSFWKFWLNRILVPLLWEILDPAVETVTCRRWTMQARWSTLLLKLRANLIKSPKYSIKAFPPHKSCPSKNNNPNFFNHYCLNWTPLERRKEYQILSMVSSHESINSSRLSKPKISSSGRP